MFGILGALFMGAGFAKSNIDQKYNESVERNIAKKKGWKFYTDSHGNQRDVNTNRIIPESKIVPKPRGYKKPKVRYKVVNTRGYSFDDWKNLPAVAWFDNYGDAYRYSMDINTPDHAFLEPVSVWDEI